MNRRTFHKQLASLALGTSALARAPIPTSVQSNTSTPASPAVLFQLSLMLWTVFTDLPFEERLAKVAEAGYKNVQLTGEVRTWTEDDILRINANRKRLGINFDLTSGMQHDLGNPAGRDALVAELKDRLVLMEKLDSPALNLRSGNIVPGLSREEQHQSCIDGLKALVPLVAGKTINGQPVKLLVECIDEEENPKYYLTRASEAFDIIKAVDHPQVRFLYDLYHEQISEGNLIEKLQKNLPYVAVIHIADVPGRHEPGSGEINFTNIYRKLVELRFDGMVAMEFRPTGDPVAMLRAARVMAESAANPA